VTKYIFIIIALVFINNCSLNKNSSLWENKAEEFEARKNFEKILVVEKKDVSEFNKNLKLDQIKISSNNKVIDDQNNLGSQKYQGQLIKIANYNFSKMKDLKKINFKPAFLKDGMIFFNKKGTIIRFNENQKVIWKKNYYSKGEKKLQPKLNFLLNNNTILVTDSVAKLYSVDLNTGELKWLKRSTYPFNSEIKRYKDKIFVIDYKNTLRCYKVNDGSECWSLPTEDSFRISGSKYSLIIIKNNIIFNNSLGDVTAVDIESGLITWQLPTQSGDILSETHNFKMSNLVSDTNSIFFSNTKNEFYSIDSNSGTINWMNSVNSNIAPIIIGNLIFSISNEGFLHVIQKNNGNIIRITDIFLDYREKKSDEINPIGFSIGNKHLYLSNGDGRMIVVDLKSGNTIKIEKISRGIISKPYIFNNNLYVVKNGSIVQYN
tara:strand:- start:149 stop:1447 length:1299 start_codon:yes stop_codon:yes gene_type:complete